VSGGVAMCGFNTEGDIMHTKLLIDGIPSNVNSGVGLLDTIFPFEIDRVDLVKGTNDPRYGLLNIAGNVHVFTSAPGRYSKAKVMGGAYGTADTQAAAALNTGRLSHVYFGGYRRSEGYRDNSNYDRYAFSGKWSYAPASEQWRVGAIARVYDFDTQAPGYLTAEEMTADPRQSPAFSATDGGVQRTRHASLHVDRAFTPAVSFSAKAYYQTYDQQRWVRFTAGSAQQERLEDEAQSGAMLTMTWRPARWRSRATVLSWGLDFQTQDNLAQRYRTVDRERQAVLRHHVFDFSNGGAYVMADTHLTRWLRVTGGVRGDRMGGTFTDELSGANLPVIDYGTIWQPKGGFLATVREGVNIYGNIGRSFQVGVGAAAYGRQPLGYSKNDGWEIGVRAAPVGWLAVRLGLWGQDASDELRLKFDNSGDSENVGKTRRRGWNVELTAKPHVSTYLWGTFTHQKATLVEPGAAQPELKGHELNHTPHFTAKAGVDVTVSPRVLLSTWLEAQGDYYLTTSNTMDRYGDRRLVNLDAYVTVHRTVTLGAHVKNLFDGFHEYAWFDGATVLHSPGERRAFYLTSTLEF
jgi:iron complex outermembrane receptor protein